MKILYIASRYDYGKVERGYSFEHYNFYESLIKMENGRHQVVYFAFDEIIKEFGRETMNKKLLEKVKEEKPDLCFFFLFTDEIYPETIKKITDSGVLTYNWFADDHWRWSIYSRFYASNFSWVSTTDSQAIVKYKKIGYQNIIHTQWACNHFMYSPPRGILRSTQNDGAYEHEVSFVGQPHSDRKRLVEKLSAEGVQTNCFGGGWPNGRVNQDKMIEIFGSSKINLNPTKSSGGVDMNSIAKIFLSKKQGKLQINWPWQWSDYFQSFLGRRREQIKGRNFEIPGCGGFLLSGWADNISDYYLPDQEMVFYKDQDELIAKVKYYLNHDLEREAIRQAGYERTVKEHTYEKRFQAIFKEMGLK
ncbi:MAG: glycosyltransferase [Candidatus Magasanikbacteria bacterium]